MTRRSYKEDDAALELLCEAQLQFHRESKRRLRKEADEVCGRLRQLHKESRDFSAELSAEHERDIEKLERLRAAANQDIEELKKLLRS